MEKEDDKPKVVINIEKAYNVNPAATVVNNTFNISSGHEAAAAVREAINPVTYSTKPNVDITSIRAEILNYVSRVRQLLTNEAKNSFMKMWEDILSLPEVEVRIYNHGKQDGTNFNRNLVANILYYLRTRKIYKVVYRDNINAAAMAQALENNKEHSVKHALLDNPPEIVRLALERLLTEKY